MARIGSSSLKLVSLDFDGVLHPSTDISDFHGSGLPLAAYVQTRPHLLRWARLLEDALKGSTCEVVVHSSWREKLQDSEIRDLLAPSGLGRRFIGTSPKGVLREKSILDVIRIMGIPHEDLMILDDAHGEFEVLAARLVACNPLVGINDPVLLDRIRRWANDAA